MEEQIMKDRLEAHEENDGLTYEPPTIVTYSGEDLVEKLGPAHACTPFGVA